MAAQHVQWINLASLVFGILLMVASAVFMDEVITFHNFCLELQLQEQDKLSEGVSCKMSTLLMTAASFGIIGGTIQVISYALGHLTKWKIWCILQAVVFLIAVVAFSLAMSTDLVESLSDRHTECRNSNSTRRSEFSDLFVADGLPTTCESFRKVEFFLVWSALDALFGLVGAIGVYLMTT